MSTQKQYKDLLDFDKTMSTYILMFLELLEQEMEDDRVLSKHNFLLKSLLHDD